MSKVKDAVIHTGLDFDVISRLKRGDPYLYCGFEYVFLSYVNCNLTLLNPVTNRRRVLFLSFSPALTKQEPKASVDINNIVAKRTISDADFFSQAMSEGFLRQQFGDSPSVDYKDALDVVIAAERSFDALPAKLRQRFGNDPASFLAFVSDDKNIDEAVKLGLIDKSKISAAPAPSAPDVTKEVKSEA